MQKKLIALAIAGLATAPAFAQSNVTIYGVADVSVESVKAGGATDFDPGVVPNFDEDNATRLRRTRVTSNSSLLGFKGAEDLGNGLKAIYQFETTVNGDTGGFGGGRDTFVGLTSNFGTVVLGNLTHPLRAMGTKVDFTPGATGIAYGAAMYGEVLGLRTGTDDRAPNAVAYVSPSFSGLTGTAAYVATSPNSSTSESRLAATTARPERRPYQWQLAGQYENGPIYAGIGYHVAKDPQVQIPLAIQLVASGFTPDTVPSLVGEDELKVFRVAGKYTFGFGLSIAGLWDRQKYNADAFGGVDGFDARRDAWKLGVAYDTGPHNVFLQYAQANKLKGGVCGLAHTGDPTGPGACDDTKSRMWSVGYNYSLSKRTMIKTYYSDIRNDRRANYDYYTAAVSGNGSAAGTLPFGADPKGFGVGIRHVF